MSAFDTYLSDMSRYPLLSRDEEATVAAQYQEQGFLIENRRTSAEQREYASQSSTTQDGRTGTRAKGIVLG